MQLQGAFPFQDAKQLLTVLDILADRYGLPLF